MKPQVEIILDLMSQVRDKREKCYIKNTLLAVCDTHIQTHIHMKYNWNLYLFSPLKTEEMDQLVKFFSSLMRKNYILNLIPSTHKNSQVR